MENAVNLLPVSCRLSSLDFQNDYRLANLGVLCVLCVNHMSFAYLAPFADFARKSVEFKS